MNRLLQITLNDLRITLSERGIFINLVVIPIVLIVAVGIAQGGFVSDGDTPVIRIDVLTSGEQPGMRAFKDGLRSVNPTLTLCPEDGVEICQLNPDVGFDEALIRQRVEQGIANGAVILPDGFDDALLSGERINLTYLTTADPMQPSALLQSVEAIVNRMTGASVASQVGIAVYNEAGFQFSDNQDADSFRQAIYDEARTLWDSLPVLIDYVEAGNDGSSAPASMGGGFRQSVPGMGSMYVMFTVLAGISTLLLERKHWTLQRLMMMPVSRSIFIGGKLFARFLMGMLQFGIAFATGAALGVSLGDDVLALLLIMIGFVTCIASIAFLLATFVRTDQQAGTAITFIALTLAPLGGAWWPLEIVPNFMQAIAYLTPVGWAMDGFTRIIFYGAGVGDVLLNVGILLLASVVLFSLAVSRFAYD